jgi:hypothetical protein
MGIVLRLYSKYIAAELSSTDVKSSVLVIPHEV